MRSKKHGYALGKNIDYQAANFTNVIPKKNDSKNPISLLGNLIEGLVAPIGSTILTFGNIAKKNVWGLIQLLQEEVNATVLSQPFIITTNMKEATITIGEDRRIVYQKAIGESEGNKGGAQGFKTETADLKIKVKPQINLDGVITMNIEIDIKEFIEQTGSLPDTTRKHLKTKVSIADGQILVLGGFVKTKIVETIHKTPFFGDIPVFGWFFKHKSREVQKEYIFMFMSPTIIKPRTSPGVNLYTKMKLYRSKKDIEDAIEVGKIKDPIHNWFFNPRGETYSHKITDYANARYQPTSVDILSDPYYRTQPIVHAKNELTNQKEVKTVKEVREVRKVKKIKKQTHEQIEKPELSNAQKRESSQVQTQTQDQAKQARRQKLRELLGVKSTRVKHTGKKS